MVTYKEPQPHATWPFGRGAPAFGSQAPFHQRYSHYKYHGYAGAGATSPYCVNCPLRLTMRLAAATSSPTDGICSLVPGACTELRSFARHARHKHRLQRDAAAS